MGTVFRSPFRVVGGVLALVGVAMVFVFVPLASADSPSGPNQVTRYFNTKNESFTRGSSTNKVGLTQIFIIAGKNFEFEDGVECWSPTLGDWEPMEFETIDSKNILAEIANPDCLGKSRIRVFFDNFDVWVVGPLLKVT